jgi:hypothetical protein
VPFPPMRSRFRSSRTRQEMPHGNDRVNAESGRDPCAAVPKVLTSSTRTPCALGDQSFIGSLGNSAPSTLIPYRARALTAPMVPAASIFLISHRGEDQVPLSLLPRVLLVRISGRHARGKPPPSCRRSRGRTASRSVWFGTKRIGHAAGTNHVHVALEEEVPPPAVPWATAITDGLPAMESSMRTSNTRTEAIPQQTRRSGTSPLRPDQFGVRGVDGREMHSRFSRTAVSISFSSHLQSSLWPEDTIHRTGDPMTIHALRGTIHTVHCGPEGPPHEIDRLLGSSSIS